MHSYMFLMEYMYIIADFDSSFNLIVLHIQYIVASKFTYILFSLRDLLLTERGNYHLYTYIKYSVSICATKAGKIKTFV